METPCQHKRGSFLKLVDTIASEIGEFRQEMVQTDLAIDRKPGSAANESSEKDMGNASLEKRESKAFSRDSGYDSFSHKLSILDKLLHTHPVWLQLGLSENETRDILQSQPPGTFLVRKSMKLQRKVISLRLPKEAATSLKEYSIKESSYTFSVEGSGISFADLFRLIAFHCISRDVLPFTLRLPHAITGAKTESELEEIAQLGLRFWQSPVNNKPPPPPKPLPSDFVSRGSRHLPHINGVHSIRTRTPLELECSQTNGALCFINPLFLEVHNQDAGASLKRQGTRAPEVDVTRRPRAPPPRPPPPCLSSVPTSLQLCGAAKEEAAGMPEIVSNHQHGSNDPSAKKPAPIPPPRRKKQQQTVFIEWDVSARTSSEPQACPSATLYLQTAREMAATPPDMASSVQTFPDDSQPEAQINGQRLSDLSISTSSSDSLDLDRTIPFYDYEGDSFESDQESMAPPLKPRKKRSSTFGFPKIVKTQLRKMSGVFSSLMTPEKKMVKKIAELSRDKRTYFGSLVQDYISFVQENKECHVSGIDMLQTIRQFMTQVKNYLSQSSELDPPIESLIPEDQIDPVRKSTMWTRRGLRMSTLTTRERGGFLPGCLSYLMGLLQINTVLTVQLPDGASCASLAVTTSKDKSTFEQR